MTVGKGTAAAGKRHHKSHITCNRCGERAWHIKKGRCASCGGGASPKLRKYNWAAKALRRRTTGTGRMRHLKVVQKEYAGIKKHQIAHANKVSAIHAKVLKGQL
eukprot:TRINITY_DN256_c0_g1_i1.p2 TRINITY_DN256_c0_g1~~TRINITY_DN256_c0_g1_i1.p2  ORF type:complete len:104 (-),score=19.55 TRINITY_DN256_c0_g1_i1:51-362(-)